LSSERVKESKERDNQRQMIAECFDVWWACHQDKPTAIRDVDSKVWRIIDPQGHGRHWRQSLLEKLADTRIAGFVFTRQAAPGKWGVSTYALKRVETNGGHRGHRQEPPPTEITDAPDGPDGACTFAQETSKGD
jgi:hypothetical protein